MMSDLDDLRQEPRLKMWQSGEAILEDRKQTIHDVCDIVTLSYGTCQRITSH
jgi:hypothetical protein